MPITAGDHRNQLGLVRLVLLVLVEDARELRVPLHGVKGAVCRLARAPSRAPRRHDGQLALDYLRRPLLVSLGVRAVDMLHVDEVERHLAVVRLVPDGRVALKVDPHDVVLQAVQPLGGVGLGAAVQAGEEELALGAAGRLVLR